MGKSLNLKQSLVDSENNNNNGDKPIDWEVRPGGVLVQKRKNGDSSSMPMIKVKVAHGSLQRELQVPSQSTFGELKKVLAQETGLEPQEQRILFRGKEKDNKEFLQIAGVKDMSKLVLLEDPASNEKKLEEIKINEAISKQCEAVANVRTEIDKLAKKVSPLESAVHGGTKVEDKEFLILTELLMMQLLKLDGIEAEGEAKIQRRTEVRRVQNYVDTLDALKARNTNPFSNSNNTVNVTMQWETFDSGKGSPTPLHPTASSTKITNDWEVFD